MATWIEIRCVALHSGCLSHRNHSPKTLTIDDNASILSAMKRLRSEAIEGGWKRTALGWVCRPCAAKSRTPEGTES